MNVHQEDKNRKIVARDWQDKLLNLEDTRDTTSEMRSLLDQSNDFPLTDARGMSLHEIEGGESNTEMIWKEKYTLRH